MHAPSIARVAPAIVSESVTSSRSTIAMGQRTAAAPLFAGCE